MRVRLYISAINYGRILLILILSAFIVSCSSDNVNLPWEIDQYGRFHTQDIERARDETPFDIILPEYLPENLGPYPYIVGPMRETWQANKSKVEVRYQSAADNAFELILIAECNCVMTGGDPELNPDLRYIEIDGCSIVETERTIYVNSPESSTGYPGYIFWWCQGNIYFKVEIYGCTYNESIQIIKSMIKQI